jgi:hypothetical protein
MRAGRILRVKITANTCSCHACLTLPHRLVISIQTPGGEVRASYCFSSIEVAQNWEAALNKVIKQYGGIYDDSVQLF